MGIQLIQSKIHDIRGQRVMLDFDLAELYNVPTKALKQAVKRNMERFPEDFMFELTLDELKILRSQFVTSSWGGARYPPFALVGDLEKELAEVNEVLHWLGQENQSRANEIADLQTTPKDWEARRPIGFQKE